MGVDECVVERIIEGRGYADKIAIIVGRYRTSGAGRGAARRGSVSSDAGQSVAQGGPDSTNIRFNVNTMSTLFFRVGSGRRATHPRPHVGVVVGADPAEDTKSSSTLDIRTETVYKVHTILIKTAPNVLLVIDPEVNCVKAVETAGCFIRESWFFTNVWFSATIPWLQDFNFVTEST